MKVNAIHTITKKYRQFSVTVWNTGQPAKNGWSQVAEPVGIPPEAAKAVENAKEKPIEKMTAAQLFKYIDDNGLDPKLKELPKSEIIEKLTGK